MNGTKSDHGWASFLKFYSKENEGRKTRMGVFENTGDTAIDYWLENGLPLIGLDFEVQNGSPSIEIMLERYSHQIPDARRLSVHYSVDGSEDGIDIEGTESTTVLRFEGML